MILVKKHLLFLLATISLVITVQYLPFFYHLKQTPPDRIYLGAERYTPDYYVYLFYLNQGALGRWSVSNFYTNLPHPESLVHEEYLIIGKIGHLLGLSMPQTFYLSRSLFLIIYLLLSFWFINLFFKNNLLLRLTFLLSIFWGGIFWPTVENGRFILKSYFDFYQPPDLINRLGFEPHKLMGMSLFLIIFYLIPSTKYQIPLLLLLLCLLAGLVHGITAISLIFTIIFYLLFKIILYLLNNKKSHLLNLILTTKYYLLITILSLPLIYWHFVFTKNPVWQNASLWEHYFVQTDFKSPLLPTILGFLLVLGPLIFLSLLGLKEFLQKNQQQGLLLISFLTSNIFLFFLGFYFLETSKQRYFQTPYLVGWSILASYGLIEVCRKFAGKPTDFSRSRIRRSRILTPQKNFVGFPQQAFVLIIMTVFILFGAPNFQQGLKRELFQFGKPPIDTFAYPPKSWYESLVWAKDHTRADGVFLSLPNAGHVIPAIPGRRVFLGDFFHTPNYYDKLPIVTKFFKGEMTQKEVKNFLSQENINYIFVGYEEKALGDITKYEPGFFSEIFKNDETKIYKVNL